MGFSHRDEKLNAKIDCIFQRKILLARSASK